MTKILAQIEVTEGVPDHEMEAALLCNVMVRDGKAVFTLTDRYLYAVVDKGVLVSQDMAAIE